MFLLQVLSSVFRAIFVGFQSARTSYGIFREAQKNEPPPKSARKASSKKPVKVALLVRKRTRR